LVSWRCCSVSSPVIVCEILTPAVARNWPSPLPATIMSRHTSPVRSGAVAQQPRLRLRPFIAASVPETPPVAICFPTAERILVCGGEFRGGPAVTEFEPLPHVFEEEIDHWRG